MQEIIYIPTHWSSPGAEIGLSAFLLIPQYEMVVFLPSLYTLSGRDSYRNQQPWVTKDNRLCYTLRTEEDVLAAKMLHPEDANLLTAALMEIPGILEREGLI